jgi:hypothetical protein
MKPAVHHRRPWRGWLLCLALVVPALPEALAVERSSLEAAILFNVLQFVEWPAESGLAEGASLTLCLNADSQLLAPVKLLEGRLIRRMQLRVLKLQGSQHQCQAVYLDSAQAEQQLPSASAEAVLVIGASDFRPTVPPSIQLIPLEGRLAFDVNQRKARQVGLAISSRLLKLARTVSE